MEDLRLGVIEARFADIIWENEPLSSGVLVKLCEKELGWKKSTMYTVLKRLCERGIFRNENGIVSSVGSLPAFLAAFTTRKALTKEEVEEIKKMIDSYGEE